MKTPRIKTRNDLKGFGMHDPYIDRNKWEYDAIDGALKPLDALASSLEVKWGRGRLETLVSPETASKFDTARAKLNAAIAYNDPQDVIRRANVMMRGWQALENEAIQNGYKALPPDIWIASVEKEGENEAMSFAIVKDSADASMVDIEGVNCYSLCEIARMVRLFQLNVSTVSEVKQLFKDAELTRVAFKPDDDIPF